MNTNNKKETNWLPTYNEKQTNPLDTKIFYEQLPFFFPNKSIKKIRNTFYETYTNYDLDTLSLHHNYININLKNEIDEASFDRLLDFVKRGNKAFLSARKFPNYIMDTLKFQTKPYTTQLGKDTIYLGFNNHSGDITYIQKNIYIKSYIKDTLLIRKLGYSTSYNYKKRINFIAIPFQKGLFYIHTNPEVFTNYQLLQSENTNYINQLISYLPNSNTYFNKNQKIVTSIGDSTLIYIYSQPPLKWAWVLMLISIGLFMIFNGKRRQRIIPQIPEIKNTTTEFVKTISNLYLETDEIYSIIQKEITCFLEDIRSKHLLSTEKLDADFIQKLALKSNNEFKFTEELIAMIIKMKNINYTTPEDLNKLTKKIEAFY
ncbi:hypothetical protein [Flavicella sp.]|uniref:hypothetical protein n=1 Tax=Flavicella sp. TaxID=2957742 RepID=UPI00301AFB0E